LEYRYIFNDRAAGKSTETKVKKNHNLEKYSLAQQVVILCRIYPAFGRLEGVVMK
jgi:hypothetical protein